MLAINQSDLKCARETLLNASERLEGSSSTENRQLGVFSIFSPRYDSEIIVVDDNHHNRAARRAQEAIRWGRNLVRCSRKKVYLSQSYGFHLLNQLRELFRNYPNSLCRAERTNYPIYSSLKALMAVKLRNINSHGIYSIISHCPKICVSFFVWHAISLISGSSRVAELGTPQIAFD